MVQLKEFTNYELTLKDNALIILGTWGPIKQAFDPSFYINMNSETNDTYVEKPYIYSLPLVKKDTLVGVNLLEVIVPYREHIRNEHHFLMGFTTHDLIYQRDNRSISSFTLISSRAQVGSMFFSFKHVSDYIQKNMKTSFSVEDVYTNNMQERLETLTYCIVIAQKDKIRFKDVGKF